MKYAFLMIEMITPMKYAFLLIEMITPRLCTGLE